MSWPTRTWTVDGWKDFKTPGPSATPKGLPDDWKQHESSIDNSSYWDVIENPLYEAAANASGIDWQQFVDESFAELGSKEDYEAALASADNQKPTQPKRRMSRNGWYTPYNHFPTLGDYADKDEDAIDWGIDRNEFGSIAEDLDSMHEWLGKTIKTHALQDAPIISRGPEGSDYGIDGDIWEHYGLDKAPGPPKEMDVNYDFNLIAAKPSNMTYKTPKGYPVVDKSTESIPFGDTHYAKWSAENDNG